MARNFLVFKTLEKLNCPSPILDFGAGTGVTLEYLSKKDLQVFGIEPSHTGGTEKIKKDISDLTDENLSHFKTLLLLDVIEHLEFPENEIRKILDFCPNIKYVVITVPACQVLWSEYDVYYGHKLRYSPSQLQNIAKVLNCEIVEIRYLFLTLYLAARVLQILGLKRNVELHAPKSFFARIFHQIAAAILIAESMLPGRCCKGTSLIATLRRTA